MSQLSIQNATTWDTAELLAFFEKAGEMSRSLEDLESITVKIFHLNPKRRNNLQRYDSRVPTMSVKRYSSRMTVRVPSPLLYAPKSPLGKLALASDSRLAMPDSVRAALLILVCQGLRRPFEDAIDDTNRGPTDRGWFTVVPPPITTKATGVRATKKPTLDEWKDRAHAAYTKRRDAERRLERLEARVEKYRVREEKLDAKVAKLEARRAARTPQVDTQPPV